MFKFLKDKLKGAISKFSKKVKEEVKVEEPVKEEATQPEIKIETPEKEEATVYNEKGREELVESGEMSPEEAGFMQGYEQADEKKKQKTKVEERSKSDEIDVKEPEQKGFFSKLKEKIVSTTLSYEKFESLFSDLEIVLMENNVALEVIEKIKSDLEKNLVEKPIKRTKIEEIIKESLKNSIDDLFKVEEINLLRKIKYEEKPFIIAFFWN